MGLDQYLYRARNITAKEKSRVEARLYRNCPEHISLVENNSLAVDIRDTVATPVSVICEAFDDELFLKDNDIPAEARLVRAAYHPGGVTYGYACDGYDETFEVSNDLIDHRYTMLTTAPDNYVALCLDELHYWRKREDIARVVETSLADRGVVLENCGYYVIDEPTFTKLQKLDPTLPDFEYCISEKWPHLLYHEWY